MLKLQAVRAKPELLYRAVLADIIELGKWFSSVARHHHIAYAPISDRREWADFEDRCVSQFGGEKVEDDTSLRAYEQQKQSVSKHITRPITAVSATTHMDC